jgi:hypothetical protein
VAYAGLPWLSNRALDLLAQLLKNRSKTVESRLPNFKSEGLPMRGKLRRAWMAIVVLMGLLCPSAAFAGPFLGDWGWCWWPGRDCPTGQYSPLHYWAPELYQARACLCPSNLDQYPPGPFPPVLPTYQFIKYCCPSSPPMPSSPYADPTAYYGLPIVPQR